MTSWLAEGSDSPAGARDRRVVVDIGGSGSRLATLTRDGMVLDVVRAEPRSISDLVAAICQRAPLPSWVGLSVPGTVNTQSGDVVASTSAPWLVGEGAMLELRANLACPVMVVNDGTAHALALTATPGTAFGALCLSVGTSVALGVLDSTGAPLAALSGLNWEIGDIQLETSAADRSAWWALGESGIEALRQELGSDEGLSRFGYRLGHLARDLAAIFQPRTIGFSGGYVARYWSHFERGIHAELEPLRAVAPFAQAGWVPSIAVNRQGEPALQGLARLATGNR